MKKKRLWTPSLITIKAVTWSQLLKWRSLDSNSTIPCCYWADVALFEKLDHNVCFVPEALARLKKEVWIWCQRQCSPSLRYEGDRIGKTLSGCHGRLHPFLKQLCVFVNLLNRFQMKNSSFKKQMCLASRCWAVSLLGDVFK